MIAWKGHHKLVGNSPNTLVTMVLDDFHINRESALDLGAGNLRDAKYLLRRGFHRVVAVDKSEESLDFATKGIEIEISPIELYCPKKESFDFVVCCNTFFFLEEMYITQVFKNVMDGLRPGGIFVCNVLGKKDEWVKKRKPVLSFTRGELRALCDGYEIVGSGEFQNYGLNTTYDGKVVQKFWHQLAIVVRK